VVQVHDTSDPPGTSAAEAPRTAGAPGDLLAPGLAPGLAPAELVAVKIRGYAQKHPGRPIAVLDVGCGLDSDDLGLRRLYGDGPGVHLTGVDDDDPVTRAVASARTDLDSLTLGDLRTVPLRPRSFDVVHCDRLLERTANAEVVLDRLVDVLRPGGLLVLRMAGRDCAAGFIDRKLPPAARKLLWRWLHPGRPGPYPAVYERVVSTRGIQRFAQLRGLAIAVCRELAVNEDRTDLWGRRFAAACRLVGRLSRGRITAGHDELLMVISKPEHRFARLL
jgi:SAM-dependent methyltransferase